MPKYLLFALLLTLAAAPARADDYLNVEAELNRPGVRVLAVEFFGKDCEPCRRAAPRWKALHEKYRDRGLRFVVVALDDSGRCPNLGWSPDKEVCDLTGKLSERFGVTALPAAFVWSWRGMLLVNNGAHVDAIEQAVERELAALPRVMLTKEVPPALAGQAAGLEALVRSELGKTRKVQVLAGDRDQRDLEALRRKSQSADVDERCQLKLGQVLPANAKLTVRLTQGSTSDWLFLEMHDAEKGCDIGSGKARWRSGQAEIAVAEAVGDLLQRLRSEVQMPAGSESGDWTGRSPSSRASSVDAAEPEQAAALKRAIDAAKAAEASETLTPEQKAAAWDDVARRDVKGKNPYRTDAQQQAAEWRRLAEDWTILQATLMADDTPDEGKKTAVDRFVEAYGRWSAEPSVKAARKARAALDRTQTRQRPVAARTSQLGTREGAVGGTGAVGPANAVPPPASSEAARG